MLKLVSILISLVIFTSVFAHSKLQGYEDLDKRVENETVSLRYPVHYYQGGTYWCWGAAGLHMLASYYHNNSAITKDEQKWKKFMASVNSSGKFIAIMQNHLKVPYYQMGTIEDLYDGLTAAFDLPLNKNWRYFYYTDAQTYVNHVVRNLRDKIPTSFCYRGSPNHCIAIIGFEKRQGKITRFHIADSNNYYLVSMSAYTVMNRLEYIYTLPSTVSPTSWP